MYVYMSLCGVCVWKTLVKVIRLHSTGKKIRSILATPSAREKEEVTQRQSN